MNLISKIKKNNKVNQTEETNKYKIINNDLNNRIVEINPKARYLKHANY